MPAHSATWKCGAKSGQETQAQQNGKTKHMHTHTHPPPAPPLLPPDHVALHPFIYLLGSPSPLPQPIEAVAGVQPVVGVLTHPAPSHQTSPRSLQRTPLFSSFDPLICSVERSEPTSLLSASHSVDVWSSRPSQKRWGVGGEWSATGGGGREGAQWCYHGSSCHQCLSGNLAGEPK